MKPLLVITEQTFDMVIDSDYQRKQEMIYLARQFNAYHVIHHLIVDGSLRSTASNVLYIISFFKAVSYLLQYYEFSQRHFDLLDYAAMQLIKLYQADILKAAGAETTAEQSVHELKSELADYLYMTAMTFQTVADKTENKHLVFVYRLKAEEYCQKADALLEIATPQDYLVKMQQLYQQYSQKERMVYVRELLAHRAEEYQAKLDEEIPLPATRSASSSFSSHGSSIPSSPQFFAPQPLAEETQPLLTHRHVSDIPLDTVDR